MSSATFYEKYPETLASALSSVGGILGLVNIAFFLSWLHSNQFEQNLQQMVNRSQQDLERENCRNLFEKEGTKLDEEQ